MKKIILIFTILLIVSSCKMTKNVPKKVYNIDNINSFDDAEDWFDSIHSIPIKMDNINIAQTIK